MSSREGGMDMVMLGEPSRQYSDPYAAESTHETSTTCRVVIVQD